PEAVLPIGRVFSSSKRTNLPEREAISTWLFPVVSFASSSSSSSLIVIALIPFCLGLEYCSSGVFLTTPCLRSEERRVGKEFHVTGVQTCALPIFRKPFYPSGEFFPLQNELIYLSEKQSVLGCFR